MRQLRQLRELIGFHLEARDGEIGKLKQIYFDDQQWTVRYFVVHTGSWLSGQDVLIVPSVVTGVDEENKRLEVDLTQEQIRNCPPRHTELPVSRHYEIEYHLHYGLEPYWGAELTFGVSPYILPPVAGDESRKPSEPEHPHLRSSGEVSGYYIHARDGDIGHVEDFILEDPGWNICYLEIDTRAWLPGKHVLIAPTWIGQVDWSKREVTANLAREAIQSAPAYDDSKVISLDYEADLYEHYGMQFDEE